MQTHWHRPPFLISTDPRRIDVVAVHAYLSRSYWAESIPLELVARSIEGSLPFGIYEQEKQVGFARVISDRATFAYLADVYVLESHQGKGLSKWLMEVIMGHPELQGLRRFLLATRDAHGLYAQYGFTPLARPESLMEILEIGLYSRGVMGGRGDWGKDGAP